MHNITLDQLRTTSIFAEAARELDEKQVTERSKLVSELERCFCAGSDARKEADKWLAEERALEKELTELLTRKAQVESDRFNTREKAMRVINKATIASQTIEEKLRATSDIRLVRFIVWAQR